MSSSGNLLQLLKRHMPLTPLPHSSDTCPQTSQDVKFVQWHPSGDLLASASYDNTVRLWVNDGEDWVSAQVLGGERSESPACSLWKGLGLH